MIINYAVLTNDEIQRIWDSLSGAEKDVLLQLRKVTWDGNLVSKHGRDGLVNKGLAFRCNGFQVISKDGLMFLSKLGKLEELTK